MERLSQQQWGCRNEGSAEPEPPWDRQRPVRTAGSQGLSPCRGGKHRQVPKAFAFAFAAALRLSVLRALFCVLWEPAICKDTLLG